MEPELRAAPQHVFRRPRPLIRHQIIELAPREAAAEVFSQILKACGVAEHGKDARAIGFGETSCERLRQEGLLAKKSRQQRRDLAVQAFAAGKRRHCRPGRPHARKELFERFQRMFGEPSRRRDLAAEDGERRSAFSVEVEGVVARHDRGLEGPVVEKRPKPRVARNDILARDLASKTAAHGREQIVRLAVADRDRPRGALVGNVGRADQRELAFVGNDKDDAAVGVLQDIGVLALIESPRDEMRALYKPHMLARDDVKGVVQHLRDIGPGGVDERFGLDLLESLRGLEPRDPSVGLAFGGDEAHARIDERAEIARRQGVRDDEPRVVDPAIRVSEALREALCERRAIRGPFQRNAM